MSIKLSLFQKQSLSKRIFFDNSIFIGKYFTESLQNEENYTISNSKFEVNALSPSNALLVFSNSL